MHEASKASTGALEFCPFGLPSLLVVLCSLHLVSTHNFMIATGVREGDFWA